MMFRATLASLIGLLFCAATATSGTANTLFTGPGAESHASSDEAAKPDLHARLEKLGRDKQIRVQHTTRGVLEGRFSTVTNESLNMEVQTLPPGGRKRGSSAEYETQTMALSDVDTVWKRKGYTLIGGLMGAVVGGLVGAAAAPDEGAGEPGVSIGAGALLFTVAGLVVGHQIHSYSMIYPQALSPFS